MSEGILWAHEAQKLEQFFKLTDGKGTSVALTGDLKILAGYVKDRLVALQIRPYISGEGSGCAGRYVDVVLENDQGKAALELPLPGGRSASFSVEVAYECFESDDADHIIELELIGENIHTDTSVFRVKLADGPHNGTGIAYLA